jgi:hypothetical protein
MRAFVISISLAVAVLVSFWAVSPANAQCRVGSGPEHYDGVPYCSELQTSASPALRAPVWATRYGAIATASGGIFGSVTGLSSRKKSEAAAMKQCKAKGGPNCAVIVRYFNQCAALAWGDMGENAASAPDVEQAEELAMAACSERSQNCKIYNSACSIAERVR